MLEAASDLGDVSRLNLTHRNGHQRIVVLAEVRFARATLQIARNATRLVLSLAILLIDDADGLLLQLYTSVTWHSVSTVLLASVDITTSQVTKLIGRALVSGLNRTGLAVGTLLVTGLMPYEDRIFIDGILNRIARKDIG